MYRSLILLAGGLVLLSAVSLLSAEEAVLEQMYGSGVHAYFSRDYVQAHEYLTTAIDGGSRDPRTHYFRGMTYLKLGRAEEAKTDFQKGAEKESRDVNRIYAVSKSLERVQGQARLTLEKHRVKARLAARERAEKLHKARYDQIRQEEGRLLRQQIDEAPAEVPPAEPTTEPEVDDAFDVGPVEEPATEPAEEPAAEPAEEPAAEPAEEPAQEDPFGDEPDDEPVIDEPADEPAAEPAEEPAIDEPAAEPAEDEPFDADAPAEPAIEPAAKPAGGKKRGGLFGALSRSLGKAVAGGGDQPAAEPDNEPAAEPEADDPFDNEAPAEEPAIEPEADDPFDNEDPAEEPAAEEPAAEEPAIEEPAAEEPAIDADDPFSG